MWIYLLKRLAALIPTLLGVLTLTFVVTQFVPGGPIDHIMTQIDREGTRSGTDGDGSGGGWSYSGRGVTFRRNPDYWGKDVPARHVQFRPRGVQALQGQGYAGGCMGITCCPDAI
jgi:ABC-type microcin C transport system permease subunit YejB